MQKQSKNAKKSLKTFIFTDVIVHRLGAVNKETLICVCDEEEDARQLIRDSAMGTILEYGDFVVLDTQNRAIIQLSSQNIGVHAYTPQQN